MTAWTPPPQAECGFQFTSKMEGMFADLATSRDTLSRYKQVGVAVCVWGGGTATGDLRALGPQALGDGYRFGVDISPTVLTTGFWPIQPVPPCTLTPQVQSHGLPFPSPSGHRIPPLIPHRS